MKNGAGYPAATAAQGDRGTKEAAAALHALVAGVSSSNGGLGRDKSEDRSLRQVLRAEIEEGLSRKRGRPGGAAARLAEVEAQVQELVAQGTLPLKPATPAPPSPSSNAGAEVPPRPEILEAIPRLLAVGDDEELLPVPTGPEPPARRQPHLVLQESGAEALRLRMQVQSAHKRLEELDSKVTRLTQALKKGRSELWDQRRKKDIAESRITGILRQREAELPRGRVIEEQSLQEEERELVQELAVARAEAARWSTMAKRQDGMLQQECEEQRGGDYQAILAKHPAGEVFMPRAFRDDGRDGGGQEDVSLGSSEDEPEGPRGRRGGTAVSGRVPGQPSPSRAGGGPRVPDEDSVSSEQELPRGRGEERAPRTRPTLGADDEESGSNLSSPSSGGVSPSGANAQTVTVSSGVADALGRALRSASAARGGDGGSSSESESDDDRAGRTLRQQAAAGAARNGTAVTQTKVLGRGPAAESSEEEIEESLEDSTEV